MEKGVYLSDNSAKRILGWVFDQLLLKANGEKISNISAFSINDGSDFCKLIKSKKLKIDKFAEGGVGVVGNLKAKSGNAYSPVYMLAISMNSRSQWFPYYVPVIAKSAEIKYSTDLTLRYLNGIAYINGCQLQETLATQLGSWIFEMGLSPCFVQTFGAHECGNDVITVSEQIVGKEVRTAIKTMDVKAIANMVAHLNVAFWIAKRWFGLSFYDAHVRNIMVEQIPKFEGERGKKFFAGRDLSTVKYFVYKVENKELVIENDGFLPRIVDLGFSTLRLYDSALKIPVALFDNCSQNVYCGKEVQNHATQDAEINFFRLNILAELIVMRNRKADATKLVNDYWPDLKDYENLEVKCGDKVRTWKQQMADMKKFKDTNGREGAWFFRPRNVGTSIDFHEMEKRVFSSPKPLASGTPTNDNSIVINALHFPARNEINKYLMNVGRTLHQCMNGDCMDDSAKTLRMSPYLTAETAANWVTNQDTKIWAPSVHRMRAKSYTNIENYKLPMFTVPIYRFQFEPYVIKYGKIYPRSPEQFVYKFYHRNTRYQEFEKKLHDKPYPQVTLNLVMLNKERITAVTVLMATPLDSPGTTQNKFITINGSYFVVQKNVADPINKYLANNPLKDRRALTNDDIGKPVGSYYFREKNWKEGADYGTVLPIPPGYETTTSVVFLTKYKNQIQVVMKPKLEAVKFCKTKTLQSWVQMLDDSGNILMCESDNGDEPLIVELESDIFEFTDDGPIFTKDAPPELKDGKIQAMFETGPTLVQGKNVFTSETMINSEFSFYDIDYRVSGFSKSPAKYSNEETEMNFPFGQRHSSVPGIVSALVEFPNGLVGYAVANGRGYGGIGIDRAQFAAWLYQLGAVNAVSLDGGFSANVFASSTQKRIPFKFSSKTVDNGAWLLPDPERRDVGYGFRFNYNG